MIKLWEMLNVRVVESGMINVMADGGCDEHG